MFFVHVLIISIVLPLVAALIIFVYYDKVLPQDKKKENEVNTDQELTEGDENNEDLSSELIVGTVAIETTKLFFEQISVFVTPIPKGNK